jgi:hypothetical protein
MTEKKIKLFYLLGLIIFAGILSYFINAAYFNESQEENEIEERAVQEEQVEKQLKSSFKDAKNNQNEPEVKELSFNFDVIPRSGLVRIIGTSNLPEGTKIGVSVNGLNFDYFGQDFNVLVAKDGSFESQLFSNGGNPIQKGEIKVEVILHFTHFWQSEDILNQLQYYKGEMITRKENKLTKRIKI